MAKRCLIVSYYFPPTGGGGVQRIAKLIKYLSRAGWQFVVLTAENEPANLPEDHSLLSEIPPQTKIIKVAGPFKKENTSTRLKIKSNFLIRWLSSLFFIPDARRGWIGPFKLAVKKILKEEHIDIIVISSPPYSLEILAADLTSEVKVPVVADLRDPWTTNPYKIHPSYIHKKMDRKTEFNAISKIKYGVSAYSSLVDFYNKSIPGFNAKNWQVITNGFDKEDFNELHPERLDKNILHIAFSGTFYSHINRPHFLLQAISALDAEARKHICFHHIGDSVIDLKKAAASLGIAANIKQWFYQPHKRCLEILSAMDAFCFILDSKNINSCNTVGGKVYEYLYLQKPVLALVPEQGEAANLINDNQAGEVIDPYNTNEITRVLKSWINKRPACKTNLDAARYDRFELAQKYAKFLETVISDYS